MWMEYLICRKAKDRQEKKIKQKFKYFLASLPVISYLGLEPLRTKSYGAASHFFAREYKVDAKEKYKKSLRTLRPWRLGGLVDSFTYRI